VTLAVVVPTAIAFALLRPVDADDDAGSAAPVTVESTTRHQFTELEGLIDASDLVVRGEVLAVEPGRLFGAVDPSGDASEQAVRSQVVTIRVDDVLATVDPTANPAPGTVVLVEEEATLADGTPLRVDGARPTRMGDEGIWFLAATGDPDFPGFTVVNSQGRYLHGAGDALRGADRSDALVRSLEGLGAAGLARAVSAPSPG
jgi:hypothetical protein